MIKEIAINLFCRIAGLVLIIPCTLIAIGDELIHWNNFVYREGEGRGSWVIFTMKHFGKLIIYGDTHKYD